MGQFNVGFIIGKLDEDLFIVDQVNSNIVSELNSASVF